MDVRGEAATDAAVSLTTATQGTPQSPTRTGKDFYRELTYTNTSAAVSDTATITATRSGPPVQSASEERPLFLPQTPESFDYDDDGNLTEDGRWIYRWDAEDRLIAMETKTSIVSAFPGLKQKLEFAYDSQGRRIRKQVQTWDTALNSGAGDWATVTDLRFVYDGWNLLMELDALNANAVVRSYAWGLDLSGTLQGAGGVGGLLWANTTTHSFAASSDGNGNIVAWVNTASLAFAGRADYGAFGEPVMRTGMANALPFGFSSKYTDAETDLVYYGFRYYNASTGRWLSRDLIGESDGPNLYHMISNDPLNNIDYMGLRQIGSVISDGSNSYLNIFLPPADNPHSTPFLEHYWTGGGREFDLERKGFLDIYRNAPHVKEMIQKMKDKLHNEIMGLDAPYCFNGTFNHFGEEKGHPKAYFESTSVTKVIMPIGNGLLYMNYGCNVDCCISPGRGYACDLAFTYEDWFKDPLSLPSGYEMPLAKPYPIVGDWIEKMSYLRE